MSNYSFKIYWKMEEKAKDVEYLYVVSDDKGNHFESEYVYGTLFPAIYTAISVLLTLKQMRKKSVGFFGTSDISDYCKNFKCVLTFGSDVLNNLEEIPSETILAQSLDIEKAMAPSLDMTKALEQPTAENPGLETALEQSLAQLQKRRQEQEQQTLPKRRNREE